jgi:hypothetical protein
MASFQPGDADHNSSFSITLGFRCLRPPVEAEVLEERKQPVYVNSRVIAGRVRSCAGPWRSNGDWWSEDAWRIQEWDIELSRGLYRLSCDLPSHVWRLVGVYD